MIFFDDTAKEPLRPNWLVGKEVATAREAINTYLSLSDAERRQTDLPPVWKMTFSSDVIVALATWSSQRCAFCEQRREDIAPYRFRPPGYAQPLSARNGKDSYLALAFAWSNLFPICEECRPEKLSHFPVSGGRARFKQVVDPGLELNEDATLFYPGERGITRSLKMTGAGLYIPAGPRARLTVEHFRLNRAQLVAARSHNLATFIELIDPHVRPAQWVELFSTDEFGSARYLYLRRLMRLIAHIHGLPALRGLEPPRLQEALIRWNSRIDLRTAVFQAADTLRHDDSALERDSRRDADAGESSGQPRPDGPSHRIKAVHIETFKSLEDIAFKLPARLPVAEVVGETNAELLRPEAPCLLILGENATGKSSILEAIALACLSTLDIDVMELDADDFTLNPKYMGSDHAEEVHDSRVRVEFHDGSHRTLEINSRPGTRFPFRQVAGSGEAPPVFAYGARRLYGAAARRGERRHHDTLFLNDRNLSNPEAWLRSLYVRDEDALDEVVSALRHIIQIDGSFETIAFPPEDPEGGGVIRIRKMLPDDKSFVVPQPLKVVSSGYRAILALVCDVLEGLFELYGGDARAARRAPALILIDEIEAHLHPRWKLNIVAGLRQALPKATFIFTSHDPLCLRGMHNGEVMALNRYHNVGGEGRELPERVERVSGFENVESMTIEQLLTSDLFQLLSTDDRQTEIDYARMADILASEKAGAVAPGDAAVLKKFRAEIAEALPYGRGEIPMLVQEAVAEFLRDRRLLDADSASAARVRAKEQIKKHLRGLLG